MAQTLTSSFVTLARVWRHGRLAEHIDAYEAVAPAQHFRVRMRRMQGSDMQEENCDPPCRTFWVVWTILYAGGEVERSFDVSSLRL